jgi:peroxiredoxin
MPELAEKYQDFASSGLVILAVNVTSQDSIEGAAQFVEDYSIPFPILLDVEGTVEELYNASSTPTTIFVDETGQIVARHFGPMSSEEIDEYIDLLTASDA